MLKEFIARASRMSVVFYHHEAESMKMWTTETTGTPHMEELFQVDF